MQSNFDINTYSDLIKASESRGNYSANNGIAFGAYQFTRDTLDYLQAKYNLQPLNVFDNTTATLQDEYFSYFVSDILNFIENNQLNNYIGFYVTGANKYPYQVPVTIYGLVAGAHLGGETGLKNFLTKGIDNPDSNGTYISDYIAKFSSETATSGQKKNIRTHRFYTLINHVVKK